MAKVSVESIREETPAEAVLPEWFEKQALNSPDTLAGAAQLLIGLITGLLGVMFGALTVAAERLPSYMYLPVVRWLGAATVVLLLLSLYAALFAVLPMRWGASSTRPASMREAFDKLLGRKSLAVAISALFFCFGLLTLGAVLILALLTAQTP